MGYKSVCFTCRKAFNVTNNIEVHISLKCPNCGGVTTLLNQKFKPPKTNDIKQWEVVEFLKNHGFIYQHIYKNQTEVPYPKNMKEAKEFFEAYKTQSVVKK